MSRRIKERPIGTIFKRYNKQLKVVQDYKDGRSCSLCVFSNPSYSLCGQLHSNTHCYKYTRKDNIGIHYEEIKD